MESIKNIIIPGSAGKPISLDIFFIKGDEKLPVVIYAHGFNGFKDWGNFDLISKQFAAKGFVFVKFNFSHNGTSPSSPEEFVDLDAFGNNNYSKQLEDLDRVINWVCDPLNTYHAHIDSNKISLIGHSMGSGIAILHAANDKRIKKLISWAGISECKTPWGGWPQEKMQEWIETGVQYYLNGRTKQQMPLYFQLYEDYIQNEERFSIANAIQKIDIPILICHGSLDNAVPVEKAFELKQWQPSAKLFILESDHVFGRSHPWHDEKLPPAMEAVVEECLHFLKS